MADEKVKDRSGELDAGSPHMAPEDYRKAGLGEFDPKYGATGREEVGRNTSDDSRIRGEVEEKLREFPRITVAVEGRIVVLGGEVDNLHLRRQAAELAGEVRGVSEVKNRVQTRSQHHEGGPVLTTREPGSNKGGSTPRS